MQYASLEETSPGAPARVPSADFFAQPSPPAPYKDGGEGSHYLYRMSRQDRRRPQADAVARRGWQEGVGGSAAASSLEHEPAAPVAGAGMSCINCRCDSGMTCAGSSDPVCAHCTGSALATPVRR
jgi:hypothetical protein